jgi:prepilin-type N-terminal cleavage/methylation domain-containing protein
LGNGPELGKVCKGVDVNTEDIGMKAMVNAGHKQRGFTLIEIAIVLVIVGLLVGGILQGQSLIESSRVKQAVRSMNSVSAAVFSYQDRYGALPGDDGPIGDLTARGASWAAVIAGDNDGILEVPLLNTWDGATESGAFWQMLRSGGFLSGNPADTLAASLPANAWGGLLGITTADMGGGMTGNKVCQSQVPGASSIAIDNELDDGLGDSGSVRATLGVGGANTIPTDVALVAPYSEDDVYTVCYRM